MYFMILCLPLSGENFYDRYFPKETKTMYNDTLFERVIWHKKVSHLVMESLKDGFYVTMLVIPETPHNFKAQTYPLHYFFEAYPDAFQKMIWLDDFLKKRGILKVKLNGSRIIEEEILSNGTLPP